MNDVLSSMMHEKMLRQKNKVFVENHSDNILVFFSTYENAWIVHLFIFLEWYRTTVGSVHYRHGEYKISCEFATNRISVTGVKYLHGGLDRTDRKGSSIYSPFAGIVSAFSRNLSASIGRSIEIQTSWNNCVIVYRACHLAEIRKSYILSQVKAGENIGTMGNSGRCMTYVSNSNSWRQLTSEEKNDPACQKGVHLHEMILIRDIIDIGQE